MSTDIAFQVTDTSPTLGRHSADTWPIIGRYLTDVSASNWPTLGRWLVDTWTMVGRHSVDSQKIPVRYIHTQHAESNWSVATAKLKKMKGNTNPNILQEHLKKFVWRRWHGEPHPNGSFGRLMQDIAEQYPL